jgi:hypothetical protein
MDLPTYWLVVAPGLLFSLSLFGWLVLWATSHGGLQRASLAVTRRIVDRNVLRFAAAVLVPAAVTGLLIIGVSHDFFQSIVPPPMGATAVTR